MYGTVRTVVWEDGGGNAPSYPMHIRKGNAMTDMLQEFCDSRGVPIRVDRHVGVIRGVKVLGLESRNGRTYLPEALAQAVQLYEDAKVNVNHPKGSPTSPRDYQDRIGAIRHVAVRAGEGLFGDFYFNPKHALAEQLMWDAEHAPENVGFSRNVEARVSRRGDRVVVEAISRVQSVDLVADPATTRGLFEAAATSTETEPNAAVEVQPPTAEITVQEQAAEIERLQHELGLLKEQEAARAKQAVVRQLLREFALPDPDAGEPRRGPSSVRGFWNRCWQRLTKRRCGRWSKSGRPWCGHCRM